MYKVKHIFLISLMSMQNIATDTTIFFNVADRCTYENRYIPASGRS